MIESSDPEPSEEYVPTREDYVENIKHNKRVRNGFIVGGIALIALAFGVEHARGGQAAYTSYNEKLAIEGKSPTAWDNFNENWPLIFDGLGIGGIITGSTLVEYTVIRDKSIVREIDESADCL